MNTKRALLIVAFLSQGHCLAENLSREDFKRISDFIGVLNSMHRHNLENCPKQELKPVLLEDNPLCKKHLSDFENKLSQPLQIADIVNEIHAKDPQVIALGETHLQSSMDFYPQLLNKIKESMPKFDCLVLEMSPRSYLDQLAVEKNMNKAVYYPSIYEFQNLVKFGKKNNVQIIFGDKARRFHGPEQINGMTIDTDLAISTSSEGMDERNKVLVDTIATKLGNHDCHKIVAIVGDFHLTSLDETKTISDHLREKKISLTNIHMVSTGRGFYGLDDTFFWPSCRQNPKAPSADVGFKVNGSISSLPLEDDGTGRLNDFDYAIVLKPAPYYSHAPQLLRPAPKPNP